MHKTTSCVEILSSENNCHVIISSSIASTQHKCKKHTFFVRSLLFFALTFIIHCSGNSIHDRSTGNINRSSNGDKNSTQGWRYNLPVKLQQRQGSLHRIIVPTGARQTQSKRIKQKQMFVEGKEEKGEDIVCEVYLLGTAHVSKGSCEDVKLLMESIKPDVLFVELCNQRIGILEDGDDTYKKNNNNNNNNNNNQGRQADDDNVSEESISQMTRKIMDHNPDMSRSAALSSVLLSKIQSDYAMKLGVKIGGEFQEAYKMAKIQQSEYMKKVRKNQFLGGSSFNDDGDHYAHGCAVVLGDRPVRLTLLRTWESLKFFGKLKLICGLIWSSLKQPHEKELKEWIESIMNDSNNDILSKSIEELSRHFPSVKETIIVERDTYMTCKILQIARVLGQLSLKDGRNRRICCVVGAGHCPGIKDLLQESHKIVDVEGTLRSVIETKKYRVDGSNEMASLITDIVSIDV